MTKRTSYLVVIAAAFGLGFAVTLLPASHAKDVVNPRKVEWEPWHRTAWAELTECVGKPKPFPRNVTLWHIDTHPVWLGLWDAASRRMYLRVEYAQDVSLVKHELLHILEGRGDHGPLFAKWQECGFAPHLGPLGT